MAYDPTYAAWPDRLRETYKFNQVNDDLDELMRRTCAALDSQEPVPREGSPPLFRDQPDYGSFSDDIEQEYVPPGLIVDAWLEGDADDRAAIDRDIQIATERTNRVQNDSLLGRIRGWWER